MALSLSWRLPAWLTSPWLTFSVLFDATPRDDDTKGVKSFFCCDFFLIRLGI